jgi:hypothetical protein
MQLQLQQFNESPLAELVRERDTQLLAEARELLENTEISDVQSFCLSERTKGAISEAKQRLTYFESLAEELSEEIKQKKSEREQK